MVGVVGVVGVVVVVVVVVRMKALMEKWRGFRFRQDRDYLLNLCLNDIDVGS